MNTLIVSFLLCLFQTPQGAETGTHSVDKQSWEKQEQQSDNAGSLLKTSVTTVLEGQSSPPVVFTFCIRPLSSGLKMTHPH